MHQKRTVKVLGFCPSINFPFRWVNQRNAFPTYFSVQPKQSGFSFNGSSNLASPQVFPASVWCLYNQRIYGIKTHHAFAIFKHEIKSAGFTSTHQQHLVGMRYSDPNILTSTGLCRPTCPTPVPYPPGSASGFGSWFGYHPQGNSWAFAGPYHLDTLNPPMERTRAVFLKCCFLGNLGKH